ncbi:uncharacterized protein METZ01_LOCUS488027, partial [marine metagenome]
MTLKEERLPVSFTELFSLLECLKKNIVFGKVEDFYYLSRLCLVKDEKNFDKFDKAFAKYFENVEIIDDLALYQIPDEWLRKQLESMLSDEEKARIEALGGLEKLMEEFRNRMEE